jgi:hypothetical protein
MTASGTAVARRDPVAYAMVVLSYLLMGGIAVLVDYVSAPESVVLCTRMSFAVLALAAVFARRTTLADWRRPGAARVRPRPAAPRATIPTSSGMRRTWRRAGSCGARCC